MLHPESSYTPLLLSGVSLRRLTVADAEALTALYRRVEIRGDTYRDKVSLSEASFQRHGGMFLVGDLPTNRVVLSDENNVVIGCEERGTLVGMIWYNFEDRAYPYGKIQYLDSGRAYKPIVTAESRAGRLLPGKEIIVLPEAPDGLTYLFFEMLLTEAGKAGFHYKSGEVYHLDGYEDETGFHACDLMNMPSYTTLLRTGGVPIGTAPPRTFCKDGVTFHVTPHVFLWDIPHATEAVHAWRVKKWKTDI